MPCACDHTKKDKKLRLGNANEGTPLSGAYGLAHRRHCSMCVLAFFVAILLRSPQQSLSWMALKFVPPKHILFHAFTTAFSSFYISVSFHMGAHFHGDRTWLLNLVGVAENRLENRVPRLWKQSEAERYFAVMGSCPGRLCFFFSLLVLWF